MWFVTVNDGWVYVLVINLDPWICHITDSYCLNIWGCSRRSDMVQFVTIFLVLKWHSVAYPHTMWYMMINSDSKALFCDSLHSYSLLWFLEMYHDGVLFHQTFTVFAPNTQLYRSESSMSVVILSSFFVLCLEFCDWMIFLMIHHPRCKTW